MQHKAYRWFDEMKENAETFRIEGGIERDMFDGVSKIYRFIADDTEVGKEKMEHRRVGQTLGDVTRLLAQGLERKEGEVE